MLYWICPECGHECPPAVRECPSCSGSERVRAEVTSEQQDAAASQGILALIQNFQAVPAVRLLVAASQDGAPTNGHSSQGVSSAALAEEELVPGNETNEAIDCLVRPLVESASLPSTEQPAQAVIESPAPAVEQVSEPVQITTRKYKDGREGRSGVIVDF